MYERIGQMFRRKLQEEAAGRSRITEDFIAESKTLRGFRENSLALDEGNFRIPGKEPQIFMEEARSNVSLRELASETILERGTGKPVGMSFVHEFFGPDEWSRERWGRLCRMREAGEISAVDYTMFAGITGQILINSTLKGFEHEEFKLTRAAGVYNTTLVDGEKVPGVSLPVTRDIDQAGEDLLLVKPQKAFPYLTMGENFKVLPGTEMRGGIMGVDRLSVYGDRTGLVAQNAAKGSRVLGIRKEQRGLQLLVGGMTIPYIEKFLYDSAPLTIDPYQSATGTGATQLADSSHSTRPFPFVNEVPANALTDYHFFEKCDQYASKLVDPNDGLPITFGPRPALFACYTERFNIALVLQAFQVWRLSQLTGVAPYANAAVNTVGPNPVTSQLGDLEVQTSRMLRQEMLKSGLYNETGSGLPKCDNVYWYGDIGQAIQYMTNWNIKVIMAPANSEAEFTQDIVLRWRFDERGQWFWNEPRAIQRVNYEAQA